MTAPAGAPDTIGELAKLIAGAITAIVDSRVAAALADRPASGEYLSTGEAAALAGVAPATIRRWVADGRLAPNSAGRHLRIARADIESLLRAGRRRRLEARAETPEERAARRFG